MAQKKSQLPIKILMLFVGFLMAVMLSSMTSYAAGTTTSVGSPRSTSGYSQSNYNDRKRDTKYGFITLGGTLHRLYGGGAYSESEYVALRYDGNKVTYKGRNFIAGYRRINDAHILAEIEKFSSATGSSWDAEMKLPGEHLVMIHSLMTWFQVVNGNKEVMGMLIHDGSAYGGLASIGWPHNGTTDYLDEANKQYVSSIFSAYKNTPTKGIIFRWGWQSNNRGQSNLEAGLKDDNWWNKHSGNDVEDHYHWVHKLITVEDPKEERDTTEVRPLKVFDPDIKTYHYDTTYNVGEGIPSGKPITNGIYASHWRGDYVTFDSPLNTLINLEPPLLQRGGQTNSISFISLQ